MKVIKFGEGPLREVVCANCESTLEYNIMEDTKQSELPEHNYYIICPVCLSKIFVSNKVKEYLKHNSNEVPAD